MTAEDDEMLTRTSTHVTSLTDGEIVGESDLGSIRRLRADTFHQLVDCVQRIGSAGHDS